MCVCVEGACVRACVRVRVGAGAAGRLVLTDRCPDHIPGVLITSLVTVITSLVAVITSLAAVITSLAAVITSWRP